MTDSDLEFSENEESIESFSDADSDFVDPTFALDDEESKPCPRPVKMSVSETPAVSASDGGGANGEGLAVAASTAAVSKAKGKPAKKKIEKAKPKTNSTGPGPGSGPGPGPKTGTETSSPAEVTEAGKPKAKPKAKPKGPKEPKEPKKPKKPKEPKAKAKPRAKAKMKPKPKSKAVSLLAVSGGADEVVHQADALEALQGASLLKERVHSESSPRPESDVTMVVPKIEASEVVYGPPTRDQSTSAQQASGAKRGRGCDDGPDDSGDGSDMHRIVISVAKRQRLASDNVDQPSTVYIRIG